MAVTCCAALIFVSSPLNHIHHIRESQWNLQIHQKYYPFLQLQYISAEKLQEVPKGPLKKTKQKNKLRHTLLYDPPNTHTVPVTIKNQLK